MKSTTRLFIVPLAFPNECFTYKIAYSVGYIPSIIHPTVVAPEKLQVTYLRALLQEEDASGMYGLENYGKMNDDEGDSRDKAKSLKDFLENPYVKSPKKAKIR